MNNLTYLGTTFQELELEKVFPAIQNSVLLGTCRITRLFLSYNLLSNKLICSIWNKEELPQQWNKSVTVLIHKNGDKTDCNNYQGIFSLSAAYRIFSNILLARLTAYVIEVTGDHQGGFRHNRSTMDQIFYIWQILEKKWEYNGTVHRLQESLLLS
jgi:hypothetical protein